MTSIIRVRARHVSIPLDVQTGIARRQITERHYGLVEVTGSDGITGIGFCYVGHRAGGLFTQAVSDLLAHRILGEDAYRVEGLWEEMYQEALLHGRSGTVLRAISAINNAMWDRNARAAGLPLYRFIGASATDRVPAYASGGYYLPGKTPADLAEECAGHVASGFTAVKIKVGGGKDLAEEEARVRAVRERIGSDVLLMLDANNAWSDFPTALQFIRAFEPYRPYWIEEPFSPDDIDNHARLAAATSIPVATGEIETGRWRFKELIARDAVAILQTDACVCGGISEFRRIAATAASHGLTLAPHWFHDLHVHLVASIPNAKWVEFFPDSQVLNFRELVDVQLQTENGDVLLPQTPGLGFGFVEKAVEAYAVAPWTDAKKTAVVKAAVA
ncbi:mandelate racemase/muconate lactonizing enzyme family protein [Mesorhizobium sp. M7A.F.Ca.US.006.01.1.1]|uniref:mandelate racemase/muconate lactonizing enzyme family protein n=1 Tax=Mesorhizobium sp. M7A.F.Ca.US.006.01.1.1 TaxID=2496707 RepID=UPI000FCA7B6D|nr:mandelate racemase/muconate lactonizing enzyme family protein [Mesorhizobium sp. M7A.F.Ca.US.006.01.1.1]RUZ74041.1 mandelate racemase/muconate lactonizing enzyme family protein [Mesorhizobium sp. M7A.F.Ca.US.006.01.1.1]